MSLTVMIVDDDASVQFFHSVIVSLSGLSADPLTFGSGREACNYLDQHCQSKDTYLVLLDINMPVMNGWELLDNISKKAYHHQVKVVIVTSSVDRADHEKANCYQMVTQVVEKPISEEICKNILRSEMLTPAAGK